MHFPSEPARKTLWSATLAALLFFGSHAATVSGPQAPGAEEALCDLRHPVDVTIRPAGALKAGEPLTLDVSVAGSLELADVTVELVNGGGASPIGATRAAIGSATAESPARGRFVLLVPAEGSRFLATFEVTAESDLGRITRTAVYNILPNGPADAGTAVVTPEGEALRVYTASVREVK